MPSARLAPDLDSLAPEASSSEHGTPGVVASSVYANGRRVADISIDDAGDWAHKEGHVVWIGLLEPDAELLHRVRNQFSLHHLAIEDAEHAHQRPKLEQYGEALFVVARTAQLFERRVVFGETHVFIGKGYIVSVRHGASTSYAAVRQHWEACPSSLARGEDFILWAILDFIVDNYMPVETAIAKRLASWAAILAVPTAIAGIYGMNFKNMPELEMQFGYYTVVVAIFVLCGILYWRFRKNGWL